MTWRTTKHAGATTCPECGHTFDHSTDPKGNAVPAIGDLTVCISCEAALEYISLDPFVLRRADLAALPSDVKVEIAHLQWAIRQVHRAERSSK